MRQRVIALVVCLAVAGAVVALAVGGSGGSRPNAAALAKLPVGTGGRGSTMMADATTGGAGTLAPTYPVPVGRDVTVAAPLDEPASTMAAYGLDGGATTSVVARLAKALGLAGDVTAADDGFMVSGGAGLLEVRSKGDAAWTFLPGCSAANDEVQCTASGSAGVAVVCAAPTCGTDQPCSEPPCAPQPPPRPARLPSEGEAATIAGEVLARAGIDVTGAARTVADGWSQWVVTYTPSVDGHAVQGLMTTVGVGPSSSIVMASGFLGRLTKLGEYPLAGTAVGIQRLRDGRWIPGAVGMMGASLAAPAPTIVGPAAPVPPPNRGAPEAVTGAQTTAPVPGKEPTPADDLPSTASTAPEPPTVTPIVVTGVHLVLALTIGDDGKAVLVPAYAFETSNGGALPLVPAVVDDLLQQPSSPAPGSGAGGKPMPAPAIASAATR